MTWSGQVQAMLVKDLRRIWWMLALLIGVMAVTAARITVLQPPFGESIGWYDTFIPIVIVLIMRSVVRTDPPATSTAFWATQPLEPSAVSAAKVLQVLIVTLLAIVAATVVVRWWGLAWHDVPVTVVMTVTGVVTIALCTAVLSAVGTSRMRLLSAVGLTVTGYALAETVAGPTAPYPAGAWLTVSWCVIVVADVIVLRQMYRTRDRSLWWQAGGAMLTGATAAVALGTTWPGPYPVTPGVESPTIMLHVMPPSTSQRMFTVRFDGIVSDAKSVRIVDAAIRIQTSEGASTTLPVLRHEHSAKPTPPSEARGARADGQTMMRYTFIVSSAPQSTASFARLRQAGSKVTLDATIIEVGETVQQRMPLGSAVLADGPARTRQELRMVTGDSMRLAEFTQRQFTDWSTYPVVDRDARDTELRFRLRERATGKEVALSNQGSGWNSGFSVLPGIGIRDAFAEIGRPGGRRDAADTSWWAAHELALVSSVNTRVYRIHGETVVGR